MNDTQLKINPDELVTVMCPSCECSNCTEVFILKQLPALISPNGQDQVVKIPIGYACMECKASMFNPPVLEKKKSEPFIEVIK